MAEIRFGAFSLDTATGELRRRGRVVKLSPKPVQVLAVLARAPGELVTRETIRREVWGNETFIDFEHALNFCIKEIRQALNDKAAKPRFIETLPRRGYRFLATTSTGGQGQAAPADPRIEAYEHYARGRQNFTQAGKESLELARQDFERALALDDHYALAHAGLGAVHALRCLNRRDPEDLAAAAHHLERAIALDPELAEPYPWLCYVQMRSNQTEQAMATGRRGVELQPDMAIAHYFLGLSYFSGAESKPAYFCDAGRSLLRAAAADPRWQPTWYVLSYLALLTGQYERAEFFAGRLLELAASGRGMPFVGGEIVLASVKMRRGETVAAAGLLTTFLERMETIDHMYRDAMCAVAACALGDARLRNGEVAEALSAYRRGWHTVQEHPRIVAYHRVAARAQAGLATAYAASGGTSPTARRGRVRSR